MNQEKLFKVLLGPQTSEKSYKLTESESKVVFKVLKKSTKTEIKNAVEKLFEVKVQDVNTVNVKGKSRTFNKIKGHTKDWKKAYVTLEKGQDINFLDNAE